MTSNLVRLPHIYNGSGENCESLVYFDDNELGVSAVVPDEEAEREIKRYVGLRKASRRDASQRGS